MGRVGHDVVARQVMSGAASDMDLDRLAAADVGEFDGWLVAGVAVAPGVKTQDHRHQVDAGLGQGVLLAAAGSFVALWTALQESGQPWDAFLRSWAQAEGMHAGQDILRELDARFDAQAVARGPYFFADLAGSSEADEQAAIDSALIQPNRIQYVGRRRLAHIP